MGRLLVTSATGWLQGTVTLALYSPFRGPRCPAPGRRRPSKFLSRVGGPVLALRPSTGFYMTFYFQLGSLSPGEREDPLAGPLPVILTVLRPNATRTRPTQAQRRSPEPDPL